LDRARLIAVLNGEIYPALDAGIHVGVQPEAWTRAKIIEPILYELGYLSQYREPEFKPGVASPGWVDYLLKDTHHEPAAFVEAKSSRDSDLWKRHKAQVHGYIRSYRLSPGADEVKTVRWLILTNGVEWDIVNTVERDAKPFRPTVKLTRNAELDATALSVFARENLSNLLADYNESRNIPLGVAFMQDLRSWRQHLARQLRLTDANLSEQQLADYSQTILDQIIFIRVLETSGLQPSFGLLRLYTMYSNVYRNQKAVPFGHLMNTLLQDLEADLNTELLKAIPAVVSRLPLGTFGPIIVPDSAMPIAAPIQNSVYNYDFRDLTFDLLGEIYEQYLSHELSLDGVDVTLAASRERRGNEGAFYTPAPVVQFTTARALKHLQATEHADALAKNAAALRVVDISCGSGAFLLAAFRSVTALRAKYQDLAFEDGRLGGARPAPFPSHHEIVASQLYGIDKDEDAVEVARLNLWLELIRISPGTLNRSESGKDKLPHLGSHIVRADSIQDDGLDRYFDILLRLGIPKDNNVVVVGNPPWGADLSAYNELKVEYQTFVGSPPDSSALFIERIVAALPAGAVCALVLPDSVLNRSQYAAARRLLTEQCTVLDVARLGEGFFQGVFRSAVVVGFRKGMPAADHLTSAYIFVKSERTQAVKKTTESYLEARFESEHWKIRQSDLASTSDVSWDIFADDKDRVLLARLARDADTIGELLKERGVELGQDGRVIQCADCNACVPLARKGDPWNKKCDNCKRPMRVTSRVKTLLNSDATDSVPFVIGRDMHRLTVRRKESLSLIGTMMVPVCPKCRYVDSALGARTTGERVCVHCRARFDEDATTKKRVGIDYKDTSLYAGEKVLLRQTGRGLYAALDSDSYCSQTVYVLRTDAAGLDPAYLAGVLSSRVLLYLYYKQMGVIEWQSYPHLTMEFVRRLPLPRLDLSDPVDKLSHDQIAAEARALSTFPEVPASKQDSNVLETLVRRAFGMTTDESEHVDKALDFIEQFGPLLGVVNDATADVSADFAEAEAAADTDTVEHSTDGGK